MDEVFIVYRDEYDDSTIMAVKATLAEAEEYKDRYSASFPHNRTGIRGYRVGFEIDGE